MRCLFSQFRKFQRCEAASVSVEAVIMFPLLLWAYGAMFVFWDAFKTQNVNVKATYTIADMISREPDPVDIDYIDGMNSIYAYLLDPAGVLGDRQNEIRVSVVSYRLDEDGNEEHVLEWSCATGEKKAHSLVAELEDEVPLMAVNDQVIVVESRMRWEPPLPFGLLDPAMREQMIFTSPRFVPQVLFNGTC